MKAKIQEWASSFQTQHHREPNTEDKAAVKPLYEKYRKLQVQLSQYQQQLASLQAGSTAPQQRDRQPPQGQETDVEVAALRRRVRQLESNLANGVSQSGGLVLQEELKSSEAERRAYLEDKQSLLQRLSAYESQLEKARVREEGYLSTIRYKDQVIEHLKQNHIAKGDGELRLPPPPKQDQDALRSRNLELESRVLSLEEGLRKAMRYARPHY